VINEETKLILALYQVDNLTSLLKDNEWKSFLYSHLTPIKYELERQLTNLKNQPKIKE
jgi:hypothetical protein